MIFITISLEQSVFEPWPATVARIVEVKSKFRKPLYKIVHIRENSFQSLHISDIGFCIMA